MCIGYPQHNRKPQVSNCVLLDEYRHNLSAALGHLPGDEEDLEEEEEEERGGSGNAREEMCEKVEGCEAEEGKGKREELKNKERALEGGNKEAVKILENGLAGKTPGREHVIFGGNDPNPNISE